MPYPNMQGAPAPWDESPKENAPATDRGAQIEQQHFSRFAVDAEALAATEATRAGCTLTRLSSGGYLLSRWGMSKELPDLRTVGALLRRIGGTA